jgi:uncharacterized protein (DUF2132 family)
MYAGRAMRPALSPSTPSLLNCPSSLLQTQAMSVQSLHGITLESLLTRLVEHYGWEGLGRRIDINCFQKDPSIKSSLKFLRRTPWAREQVEALYLETRFTN